MASDKTSLGTRMKDNYENRERRSLTRRTPVIVRVDGRAFHTLTRRAEKPFDAAFVNTMQSAAIAVAANMQGFKLGYVQSDEVSFLLTDFDTLDTDAWFDYNLQKVVSITAAMMTAHFNRISSYTPPSPWMEVAYRNTPVFDARAFNIPLEEVPNYFLWRAKDWERNSVQMLARSRFSQKQLHGMDRAKMLTMLEAEGIRWNELPDHLKNGTYIAAKSPEDRTLALRTSVRPCFEDLSALVTEVLTKPERV